MKDKTIARLDPAITAVGGETATFLSEKQWTTLTREGVLKTHTGLYFICDGGYHAWKCLIPPFKDQPTCTDLAQWSAHIESMRKDVECTFGILKKRFMFLKNPIRLQNKYVIQNCFFTCCLLHNWLLEYDGRDDWEDVLDEDDCDVEYGSLESMVDQEARTSTSGTGAGSWTRGQARRANPRAYMELPRHDDDESGGEAEAPPSATEQQEFRDRRAALIDHYCHEVEHRRLELHLL